MALVLLAGAGLMIRTLVQLWNVNPGFNPHGVLTFGLTPSPALAKKSPEAIRAEYRKISATLLSIPGVESASFNWGAHPLESDSEESFWAEGQPKPEHQAELPMALQYVVQPEYLRLMQTPLKRGRFINDADNENTGLVAVIDEDFARRYFPGRDPIGKHLYFFNEQSGGPRVEEIVGIVGHVKQFGLDRDATQSLLAQIYEPFMQIRDYRMKRVAGGTDVYVRARAGMDPSALMSPIRHAFSRLDKEMVVYSPERMDDTVARSIAQQRFALMLFSVFAGIALLLASIGIYGVLSYVAGQRTQEIGIRMALGAQKSEVLRAILRDGARMAVPGVAAGIIAALGLTRLMSGMLFGVKPTDPLTFASVAVLLCAVALLACYIPARRAASIDPMQALRSE